MEQPFSIVKTKTASGRSSDEFDSLATLPGSNGPAFPEMTTAGGKLAGIPVISSDGAPGGDFVLVDAAQIAARTDVITIDSAQHTSIQMDDEPVSGPTSLVSLWQSNLTGVRVERWFGVERCHDGAVAILTGFLRHDTRRSGRSDRSGQANPNRSK
jgi:hypothetical protein